MRSRLPIAVSILGAPNAKPAEHLVRHISPALVPAVAYCCRSSQTASRRTPPQDALLLRRLRLPQVRQDKREVRLQCHVQTVRPASQTENVLDYEAPLGQSSSGSSTFPNIPESSRSAEIAGRSQAEKVNRDILPPGSKGSCCHPALGLSFRPSDHANNAS